MNVAISILIGLVALLHLYFLWFEMFAWTTRGRKIFRKFPPELFEPTRPLAANQGLYNGFLAAGLIWTFFIQDPKWKVYISVFFLACVAIAGIYGALTAEKKIFVVQALPALIAIILIFIPSNETTSPMTPEQVVQKQLETYNNKDIDGFMSVIDPQIEVFNFSDGTKIIQGWDACRKYYAALFDASPLLHSTILKRTCIGNKVIDHERITGRNGKRDTKYPKLQS